MKKGDCWIDSKGRLHEYLGMRRGRPWFRMFVLPEQRTLALPDIFGTGGADSASYNSTTDDNTMRSEHATTYATARSGDGSLSVSGGGTEYVGQWKDGTAYILRRVQLPFNTSGLPDACSIDDGTRLRLYVTADYSATDFDVTVVQYSGAVPATATKTNWTAFGTTSGGATTTSGMAINAYLNINLTATGRGWVNPTGYTYLGVVSSRDISATAPTGNEYIFFNSYDAGSNRPTLEVYYTTNQAPNAPTNPTRTDFDPANVARFTWTFSDPDAGDTQSAFKLRIRPVGGAWSYAQADGSLGAEVWVNTANAYFDLAAHELDFSEDYEWQVATKDAAGAEGPYCAVQEFSTYDSLVWAEVVSPSGNIDVTTTPQQFQIRAYTRDGAARARVRLQIDTAPTFDSGDFVEYVSDYDDSGDLHTFNHTFLGTDVWYWRARAEREGDGGTATYTASGSWACPAEVNRVTVECWGGGGAGGGKASSNGSGGGGGGGAYAKAEVLTSPGANHAYTVAAMKAGTTGTGADGESTYWGDGTEVKAAGGKGGVSAGAGGPGGAVVDCAGTVKYRGGNGSASNSTTNSGAGGGGAGSGGDGGDAAGTTAGAGTADGGGNGGAGRTTGGNGNAGSTRGGGGGGALRNTTTNRSGGAGAAGAIVLTWTAATSDWSSTQELNVDTGGALPAGISPDPVVLVQFDPDVMAIAWSATLDHVTTPTTTATLRLQVQMATESSFADPLADATSSKVLGGASASATTSGSAPGTYWVRFRTLADYGDNSAWDVYEVDVATAMAFVEDPSWQGQIGTRPNRVYCQIEGGVSIQVAEVVGVAAADKVDYWVTVPAGTSNGEALATAQAVLALLQGRPVSVSGKVPITIVAAFDRQIQAQWWEPVSGTPTLRETQTLAVAKKVHDVDVGTTELHLGDYAPPAEETLARILAKLARKL